MKKTENGFIALTSVLIIGALILILAVSLFHSALTDYSISTAFESGQKAAFLADFCLAEGVLKLQEDINYIGGEEIEVNGETCSIDFVKQLDENTKEVSSLGRAGDQPHFSRSSRLMRYVIESNESDWIEDEEGEKLENLDIIGNFLRLKPKTITEERITASEIEWNNSFSIHNVEIKDGALVLVWIEPEPEPEPDPEPDPEPEPKILVKPSLLNCPDTEVGKTSNCGAFTVENEGGKTLSGSASVSSPFSCADCGYSLGPGESKKITFSFSPTSVVIYSRTVSFSGGGEALKTISGTGYEPGVILNQATYKSCATLCGEVGLSCESIGTNNSANDMRYYYYDPYVVGGCATKSGNCATVIEFEETMLSCDGYIPMWTRCKCVEGLEPGPVSVRTDSATNINETFATLRGAITNFNNNPSAEIRFRYRPTGTITWSYTPWATRTTTTTYSRTVTGLSSDTDYEFQAQGRGSANTTIITGATQSFTTLPWGGGPIPNGPIPM